MTNWLASGLPESDLGQDMVNPLLSVVIPSCNRQKYLVSIMETLLRETEAQLVVSDNSDQPLEQDVLQSFQAGERIIYVHHAERLSVVDNFERAARLATGEYMIFIGDDDCVGPDIEEIVRWARRQGVDAVVSYTDRFIANYFWPGVVSKYFGDGYAGRMFVTPFTGKVVPLDTRKAIADAANRPGFGLGKMARAYHGLVSRDLVERVIKKHGRLFGGVSPDIYSATLLTNESRKACVVDYPFVIPGASPSSTAGEGAARQDTDGLKKREHIARFGDGLQWDSRIPEFYSPVTVWSYSHQQALDLLGDHELTVNFPRLYLKCLLQYRDHHAEVKAACRHWRQSGSLSRLLIGGVTGFLGELQAQIWRVWFRFATRSATVEGLESMDAAVRALKERAGPWVAPDRISGSAMDASSL